MIKEAYSYITSKSKNFYVFESEGQNGIIAKMVIFTPLGKSFGI